MKLWVVNHPHEYRHWLQVEARVHGDKGWHKGFIWSEWFQRPPAGFDFRTPTVPPKQLVNTNIDPLVIGPHMYFDYCRKRTGRRGNRKNNKDRNELERGDLILFGCVNQGDVIIDTIFVVGETRQWASRGVPAWTDLDRLAKHVHFHPAAHSADQHPEVHSSDKVAARSYQGLPHKPNRDLFCWTPLRADSPSATTRPFVLPQKSGAYELLTRVYGGGRSRKGVLEGSYEGVVPGRGGR